VSDLGCDAAEHLALGIDDEPAAFALDLRGAGRLRHLRGLHRFLPE
jgi:hypothetical protein